MRCNNSMGVSIGAATMVSCHLPLDHDGDHTFGAPGGDKITWPNEHWLCTTHLSKEIREVLESISVLGDPGRRDRAYSVPEILEFLANVFTDNYQLVQIDPERVKRELLELRAELAAG